MNFDNLKKKTVYSGKIFFFTMLIAGSIIIFAPHIGNLLPFHIDEWHHVYQAHGIATDSQMQSGLAFFELGFDAMLSVFYFLHIDPVLFYGFLPALSFLLFGVMLLILYRPKSLKQNIFIGSFLLLMALTKTTSAYLGIKYFVPSTLGILLVLMLGILVSRFGLKRKHFAKYGIILFLLFILYPLMFQVALTATAFTLVIEALKRKSIMPILLLAAVLIASIFLLIPLYVLVFGLHSLTMHDIASAIFKYTFFSAKWASLGNRLTNPIMYVGVFQALFAVVGLWQYRKKWLFKSLAFMPFLLGLSIFDSVLSWVLGYSLFMPYERSLLLLSASTAFFSAAGIYYTAHRIRLNLSRRRMPQRVAWMHSTSVIALILLLLPLGLTFSPVLEKYATGFTAADYRAVSGLQVNGRLLTPADIAYPLAIQNNNVTIVSDGYFIGSFQDRINVERFFNGDPKNCAEKMSILSKYNAKYVISPYKINCSGLNLKEERKGIYLYFLE